MSDRDDPARDDRKSPVRLPGLVVWEEERTGVEKVLDRIRRLLGGGSSEGDEKPADVSGGPASSRAPLEPMPLPDTRREEESQLREAPEPAEVETVDAVPTDAQGTDVVEPADAAAVDAEEHAIDMVAAEGREGAVDAEENAVGVERDDVAVDEAGAEREEVAVDEAGVERDEVGVGEARAGDPPRPSPPADRESLQRTTLQMLPGRLEPVNPKIVRQELRFLRVPGPEQEVTVGSATADPPGHVTIEHGSVQPLHARMRFAEGRWTIESLADVDPVRLNREPLEPEAGAHPLADGDTVRFGRAEFVFRIS